MFDGRATPCEWTDVLGDPGGSELCPFSFPNNKTV